jgi:FKBP-type peptidyl-prolyl cis-trans isomerase
MSAPSPSPAPPPGGVSPLVVVGALVVALVVVIFVWNVVSASPKHSDGTDVTADDPNLKELAPGVKYRDIKAGVGDECPPGAAVTIHYTGWLTDGTEFDSSRGRGKAAEFNLNQLIPGWQVGIPGMKKGGVRKLVIAADKGYGERGSPPKIPGGATLIFEVELVRFIEPPPGEIKARPRRSPVPTDLTKLSDGTPPTADDPGLKPIGAGGLAYRDLKVGDGPEVRPGASVVVDYIGWRRADGKMFDSSFKGPTTFPTSLNNVVDGWKEGVPGMKVGGIRKLVIPPALGYGDRGAGADIPPGATLVFEIEVLGTQ